MKIMPNACLGNWKTYWRRRMYKRLNGNRRKVKVIRLGGGTASTGGRIWKIKVIPKLRLRIFSPVRLLARFHDAYVGMMIRVANSLGKANSGCLFGGKKIARGRHVAVVSGGEEVDSRLVMEIYKRLAASREFRTA